MFSKVFLAWKKNYGEDIVLKACSILREMDVEYVFDEPKGCDLAVMIGGDGTLLKFQSPLECPILGINPGKSVGYYMNAGNGNYASKLRRVLEGKEGRDYRLKEYQRLETKINKTKIPFLAINEVLISPIYVHRILDSKMTAKGKTSLERNSGILVYTPSGSHAYAKSAGAKELKDPKRFGVAAIAPYKGRLKRGEVILSKGQVVVKSLNREGEVSIDGQEDQVLRLKENDIVTVRKSDSPARIVCF